MRAWGPATRVCEGEDRFYLLVPTQKRPPPAWQGMWPYLSHSTFRPPSSTELNPTTHKLGLAEAKPLPKVTPAVSIKVGSKRRSADSPPLWRGSTAFFLVQVKVHLDTEVGEVSRGKVSQLGCMGAGLRLQPQKGPPELGRESKSSVGLGEGEGQERRRGAPKRASAPSVSGLRKAVGELVTVTVHV